MGRRARQQMAFTKGVLDPGLGERIDLVHYYQAVRRGRNVEFLAQGGFTRRAGTRAAYPRRLRRRLEPVALTAAMIIAHNGGNALHLVDQAADTDYVTAAVGAPVFVVLEVALPAATSIVALDLIGFRCASGRADDCLGVEWWDGTAWQPFGVPEAVVFSGRTGLRTTARTRRFAEPPGLAASTASLRVVVYGGEALGAISVAGLRLWAEQAAIVPAPRIIPFARSADDIYQLVAGDWNIDVFDAGTWLAAIPLGLPHELVAELNVEQSLDTLMLFHEDPATARIVRQGAGDEWHADRLALTNLPALTANLAFGSDSDELQRLAFPGFAAGQRLVLCLGDLITARWTTTTVGDLAGQVAAALGALPGVTGADLNVTLASAALPAVDVLFGGANGARAWPRLAVRAVGSGAAVSAVASVTRRGLDADGPIMGDTTGFPRCGAVWQSRLFLGGFRAAPQTLLVSRAGNVLDMQTTASPVTADLGMIRTLDSDAVETIEEIFIGRHLQVFTESGEWWSDNRTVDATQPLNMILASRYGLEKAVPLVFAENATLFLEKGGRTVRDFLYAEPTQSYEAEALSLLAPHLVTAARSLAFRRATSTAECNQLAVVNASGSMALLSLLRRQEVIAWAEWTTPWGAVREVATDAANRVWYAVQRGGELWLERRDPAALTDATVTAEIGPLGVVSGLPAHMVGRQVWALVAGDVEGPHTVSAAGTVTLSTTVSEGMAEVGFDFGLEVEGLDLREQLQNAHPFRPPVRIYEAELALAATGHVMLGANGLEPEEVDLRAMDGAVEPARATGDEPAADLLDVPMMNRLFTGRALVEGLEGWTENGRWRLTQAFPAPLTVRSIRLELATRG